MIYHIRDTTAFELEFCIDDRLRTVYYLDHMQDKWTLPGPFQPPEQWCEKDYIVIKQYNSLEYLMKDQFERFL